VRLTLSSITYAVEEMMRDNNWIFLPDIRRNLNQLATREIGGKILTNLSNEHLVLGD